MNTSSLLQIIEVGLKAEGFDGLWNEVGPCGCLIGNLSPGDCLAEECQPGYRRAGCSDGCGQGCNWHVVPDKRGTA